MSRLVLFMFVVGILGVTTNLAVAGSGDKPMPNPNPNPGIDEPDLPPVTILQRISVSDDDPTPEPNENPNPKTTKNPKSDKGTETLINMPRTGTREIGREPARVSTVRLKKSQR